MERVCLNIHAGYPDFIVAYGIRVEVYNYLLCKQ